MGYVLLGQLRFNQKRLDEVEKYYRQALDVYPASGDALSGLVNIYAQRKDFPKALSLVQAQITQVPNNSTFYMLQGELQLQSQDAGKAEQSFQKAIDLDKNNISAFLLLARVQTSRGEVQQAIDGYNRAGPQSRIPRMSASMFCSAAFLRHRNSGSRPRTITNKPCRSSPSMLRPPTISHT